LKKGKILIAPLDWGLGHATRCIPIIYMLRQKGADVIVAAEGKIKDLLLKEFPDLEMVPLRGYRVRYSSFFPAWLSVLMRTPSILFKMRAEHRWLKGIIEKENIGVVISDNRFGLWNKKIHSIYMTHQVMIKCPKGFKILEPLLYRLHRSVMSKYSECWIPDYPDAEENLSGDLSHAFPLPPNAKYIGPLSRFTFSTQDKFEYDVAAIISGEEPQRAIFEKLVTDVFNSTSLKSIIIRGKPSEENEEGGMRISHLPTRDLETVIASSRLIVCRAGYSGIMDLIRMKKNAILIPTPGQTEQEYLAGELMKKGIFFSMKQFEFNFDRAMNESKKFSAENFKEMAGKDSLLTAVENIMDYQPGIPA
jgi:uncharacterized protein (TIGR00661 family)